MRSISVKSVEIFSDGSINFLSNTFKTPKQVTLYEKDFQNSIFSKSGKQVTLYEKDAKNSIFSKKYEKNQQVQVLSRTSYKSRYKF